jgi:hypothetical protein
MRARELEPCPVFPRYPSRTRGSMVARRWILHFKTSHQSARRSLSNARAAGWSRSFRGSIGRAPVSEPDSVPLHRWGLARRVRDARMGAQMGGSRNDANPAPLRLPKLQQGLDNAGRARFPASPSRVVAQLMMPQAMRLPALPVLFVKVVAAAEFGVYWFTAVPTGMLP